MSKELAVSIDIETLGGGPLAPVIQIGACTFDPTIEEPLEHEIEFLVQHDSYNNVEPFAASMHPQLLKTLGSVELEGNTNIHRVDDIIAVHAKIASWYFQQWLDASGITGTFTAAGKNFAGFDQPHLLNLLNWDQIKIRHRILDPGMLYWEPQDGAVVPNSYTCMQRADMEGVVAHTALEDARVVAKLIQRAACKR